MGDTPTRGWKSEGHGWYTKKINGSRYTIGRYTAERPKNYPRWLLYGIDIRWSIPAYWTLREAQIAAHRYAEEKL